MGVPKPLGGRCVALPGPAVASGEATVKELAMPAGDGEGLLLPNRGDPVGKLLPIEGELIGEVLPIEDCAEGELALLDELGMASAGMGLICERGMAGVGARTAGMGRVTGGGDGEGAVGVAIPKPKPQTDFDCISSNAKL